MKGKVDPTGFKGMKVSCDILSIDTGLSMVSGITTDFQSAHVHSLICVCASLEGLINLNQFPPEFELNK